MLSFNFRNGMCLILIFHLRSVEKLVLLIKRGKPDLTSNMIYTMCLYILRDTTFQMDNYLGGAVWFSFLFLCFTSHKSSWQDHQLPESVGSYITPSLQFLAEQLQYEFHKLWSGNRQEHSHGSGTNTHSYKGDCIFPNSKCCRSCTVTDPACIAVGTCL